MGLIKKSHKSCGGTMSYSIYWFKFLTSVYLINEGNKVFILPQSGERPVIDYLCHNVQFLVGKYFDVEHKYMQNVCILTYSEYRKNFTKLSISWFHFIVVSSTIPVWVVLCKNSEFSKLSMQNDIKVITFYKMHFLHNISSNQI